MVTKTTDSAPGNVAPGRPPPAGYCTGAADFYTPAARALVTRLLMAWLDEVPLTTTELLCSPSHQNKLENAGFKLRNTLDRAAAIQIKQVRGAGADRVQALFDLIAEVKAFTQRQAKLAEATPIHPGTFRRTVEAAATQADPVASDVFLGAALCAYLGTTRWLEKTERLLALFDEAEEGAGLDFLDRVLGEILGRPAAMEEILGDLPDAAARLDVCLDMVRGEPPRDGSSDQVARIHALIRERNLKRARIGLLQTLAAELSAPQPLTRAGVMVYRDPRTLLDDLRIVSRLFRRTLGQRGLAGGPGVLRAFELRLSRMLTPESLHDLLEGRSVADKLQILLPMHGLIVGMPGQRAVETLLFVLLKDDRLVGRILQSGLNPVERLGTLGRVAAAFEASGLTEQSRESFVAKLEEEQLELLKQHNLLARINSGPGTPAQKVGELIELCMANAFVRGRPREAAHKLLRHHLAQPDFMPTYLGNAREALRAEKIATLKERLAGIGFA